jgi:hypothetical protein
MKAQLLVLFAILALTVSTKNLGDTCTSTDDCGNADYCCATASMTVNGQTNSVSACYPKSLFANGDYVLNTGSASVTYKCSNAMAFAQLGFVAAILGFVGLLF